MPFDPYDLLLFGLFLLLLILGIALLSRSRRRGEDPFPYHLRGEVPAGVREWHPLLETAAGEGYLVRPLVPLEDLLHPRPELNDKRAAQARARLLGKRAEFVLFRRETMLPVGGLLTMGKKEKDFSREQALLAAGLPVLRLDDRTPREPEALRRLLAREFQLDLGRMADPAGGADWVLGAVDVPISGTDDWQLGGRQIPPAAASSPAPAQDSGSAPCPSCGAPMSLRRATRGNHAGKNFLVCSRFPECRQVNPAGAKHARG